MQFQQPLRTKQSPDTIKTMAGSGCHGSAGDGSMWQDFVTNTPAWMALTRGRGCGLPCGSVRVSCDACSKLVGCSRIRVLVFSRLYQCLLLPSTELRTSVDLGKITQRISPWTTTAAAVAQSTCLIVRTPRCVLDRSVLVYLESREGTVPARLPDTRL